MPEERILDTKDVVDGAVGRERFDELGLDEVILHTLRVQGHQFVLCARVHRVPVGRNVLPEGRLLPRRIRQAVQ